MYCTFSEFNFYFLRAPRSFPPARFTLRSTSGLSKQNWYIRTDTKICQVRLILVDRGSTVVKMLCYKSEGPWIESIWFH